MIDMIKEPLSFFVLVDFDKLKDYPTELQALSIWEEGRQTYMALNKKDKLSIDTLFPNLNDKLPYLN